MPRQPRGTPKNRFPAHLGKSSRPFPTDASVLPASTLIRVVFLPLEKKGIFLPTGDVSSQVGHRALVPTTPLKLFATDWKILPNPGQNSQGQESVEAEEP